MSLSTTQNPELLPMVVLGPNNSACRVFVLKLVLQPCSTHKADRSSAISLIQTQTFKSPRQHQSNRHRHGVHSCIQLADDKCGAFVSACKHLADKSCVGEDLFLWCLFYSICHFSAILLPPKMLLNIKL